MSEAGFLPFPRAALDSPIGELFEAQAARHPGALAVKSPRRAFSYAELEAEANRLARAILARRGPGNEPVALLFAHDAPVIAAVLAVLKTGKAYIALDSHQPAAALAAILADSEAPLVICDSAHLDRARALASRGQAVLDAGRLEALSPERVGLAVSPHEPACIAYTSGSTGDAKGVVGSHRSINHRVMVFVNGARIGPGDRLSLLEAVGVGGSFRGLFGSLLTGAAVFPLDLRAEGVDAIAPWLGRERITACSAAASVFRHFAGALPEGEQLPHLRYLGIGREAVLKSDVELYRTRFSADCVLVNVMGSAEAGTMRELTIDKRTPIDEGVVPVGHAVADKEVLLLDDDGRPVPPGEVGEIVVRSEFLALGYWRRPDLDARVFPPEAAVGASRICRTGDLGRMLPGDCLIHLGRKDARAKLRGRFVDASEVETALVECPGVKGAAVVVREDRPGDQRLVAYVVPSEGTAPSAVEIRRFVQSRLGEVLAPSAVVFLHALPQAPNGKVDRRALPAPPHTRPPLSAPLVAPRTQVEQEVERVWADVLDLDEVGVHDGFFDLGGTSLIAGRIAARVSTRFAVAIPALALLEAPTVAEMAVVVVEHLIERAGPSLAGDLLDGR